MVQRPTQPTVSVIRLAVLLAGFSLVAAGSASAEVQQAQDEVFIAPGTLRDAEGRVAMNIAAGDGNLQVGDTVIAVGDNAATAQDVRQAILSSPAADRSTRINVADGAISGSRGILSINVTAGHANQSANLSQFTIASSVALSDQFLEQSRASAEPSGVSGQASQGSNDVVAVSDGAFTDGRGLAQINLVGGERNRSANSFQLTMSGGCNTACQ